MSFNHPDILNETNERLRSLHNELYSRRPTPTEVRKLIGNILVETGFSFVFLTHAETFALSVGPNVDIHQGTIIIVSKASAVEYNGTSTRGEAGVQNENVDRDITITLPRTLKDVIFAIESAFTGLRQIDGNIITVLADTNP